MAGDVNPAARDAIEAILFRPGVDAVTAGAQAQQLAVETAACGGVCDADGAVVDAQERSRCFLMPTGLSLVGGELQEFEGMALWIAEFVGDDASGVGVPVRQALGRRRDRGDRAGLEGPLEASHGFIHAIDHQADVLEPAVCAAGVGRNQPAWPGSGAGIKYLGELQHFRADRQTQQLEVRTGKTHQVAIGTAIDNPGCCGALKAKALGEEAGAGFGIRRGEADAVEMGMGHGWRIQGRAAAPAVAMAVSTSGVMPEMPMAPRQTP